METSLLLNRTGKNWKVADVSFYNDVIDYNSVKLAGIFDKHLLIKYTTEFVYIGGVEFGYFDYTFISISNLKGGHVGFVLSASNTAGYQCFKRGGRSRIKMRLLFKRRGRNFSQR